MFHSIEPRQRTTLKFFRCFVLFPAIAMLWASIFFGPDTLAQEDSKNQLGLNASEEQKLLDADSLFESAMSSYKFEDRATHERAFQQAKAAIENQIQIVGAQNQRLMNPLLRLAELYLAVKRDKDAFELVEQAASIYKILNRGKLLMQQNDWGLYRSEKPFSYADTTNQIFFSYPMAPSSLESLREKFKTLDSQQTSSTAILRARRHVYKEEGHGPRNQYHKRNFSEAIARMQDAISFASRNSATKEWEIAELRHQLGLLYWADNKPDLSTDQFLGAAELLQELWTQRAQSLRTGQKSDADNELFEAIRRFGIGLPIYSLETDTSFTSNGAKRFLDFHQIAAKILVECLGETHPGSIKAKSNLGFVHFSRGEIELAEANYRSATAASLKSASNHYAIREALLHNYAALLVANRRPREAAELLKDVGSQSVIRTFTKLIFLTPRDGIAYLRQRFDHELDFAVSMAIEANAPLVAKVNAAQWLANGKGIRTRALGIQNRLVHEMHRSAKTAQIQELIRERVNVANLAIDSRWNTEWVRIMNILSRESRSHRAIARFAQSVGSQAPRLNWVKLKELREQISAGEVLIDFVRFRKFDFRSFGSTEKPEHYAACIVRSDSMDVVWIDLGPASEVDSLVTEARDRIQSDISSRLSSHGEKQCTNQLSADLRLLVQKIWEPIENRIGDNDSVILSPAGQLWLVPWAALPVGKESNQQFLIEKYKFRYLTNSSSLVDNSEARPATSPVIFADPDFDLSPHDKQSAIQQVCGELLDIESPHPNRRGATRFVDNTQRLEATRFEATKIQQSLKDYLQIEPRTYLGSSALAYLARNIDSPSVVHFATHAFYIPSQDQTAQRKWKTRDFDTKKSLAESALFRCGLLLAGCNLSESYVGGDDGVLSGIDVTGMDLSGTKLVVLSACGTGEGEVENGDGVSGLRQAFLIAGADSIVASLWQVEDRETTLLMIRMYDDLAKGMTKSEALRLAQLTRIKVRRARHGAAHPFFWAAFTLTGQD